MHASSSSVTLPPLAPAMNVPPGSHHPSLSSSSSNSENGTPVPSGSAADSGKKPTAKRKRTGDSNDNGDGQPRTRDGPKKKKANRACFHCQKAHLTCDDSESSSNVSCAATCPYSFIPNAEQLAQHLLPILSVRSNEYAHTHDVEAETHCSRCPLFTVLAWL